MHTYTRWYLVSSGQTAREWSPCSSHWGPSWRPWRTMWSHDWRPTTLMGGMSGSKMGPQVILQRWRRTGWAKTSQGSSRRPRCGRHQAWTWTCWTTPSGAPWRGRPVGPLTPPWRLWSSLLTPSGTPWERTLSGGSAPGSGHGWRHASQRTGAIWDRHPWAGFLLRPRSKHPRPCESIA